MPEILIETESPPVLFFLDTDQTHRNLISLCLDPALAGPLSDKTNKKLSKKNHKHNNMYGIALFPFSV